MMQLQPLQSDDRRCVVDFPLFYPLVCLFPAYHMNANIFVFISQTVNTACGRGVHFAHHNWANEVLWRLYHEEEVTVYDPQDVEFKCTCSRERCADALKTLPDEEVDSILAEDGEIDMHCDYCGNHYLFNAMDIAEIRNNASPADPQVH